jgi:hypothetical protein
LLSWFRAERQAATVGGNCVGQLTNERTMTWNIAFMFVKATKDDIDDVVSDVLTKKSENLFFEDATSVSMGRAMGVSFYKDWTILSDVQGRVIFNDS